jgi:hypothetical protein
MPSSFQVWVLFTILAFWKLLTTILCHWKTETGFFISLIRFKMKFCYFCSIMVNKLAQPLCESPKHLSIPYIPKEEGRDWASTCVSVPIFHIPHPPPGISTPGRTYNSSQCGRKPPSTSCHISFSVYTANYALGVIPKEADS